MQMAPQTCDPLWVPGTVVLQDGTFASSDETLANGVGQRSEIVLHPIPSADPNDPLNWPSWRKHLNYALVSFYVLFTFVQLDVGFTAWEQYQTELDFSVDFLNAGSAINYGGLAIGCIFFVPLLHKYGRRPIYIFSIVLQLVSCVWFAVTKTRGDFVGSNLLSGLGGAVSETIVQVTIADLYFVHQHAVMNGWYLFATFAGAYLGPVASGYIVESQGWRWVWWWCVIFFGVNLVAVICLFEESKYIMAPAPAQDVENPDTKLAADHVEWRPPQLDESIPVKSYRQRMALWTNSEAHIINHFLQPVVLLFTFPAITFTALTYGSLLAWFAILTSVQATYMFSPPYNFSAAGVGLMNVAPFIGCFPAILYGGYLNDKSIIWLAKRNGGIYEPEMRLWMSLPLALITPAGILMCGIGLANVSRHRGCDFANQ